MGNAIILFDLNEVYLTQNFYKNEKCRWIHANTVSGINGYCDPNAQKVLRQRLNHIEQPTLSFIGSGNYHYISLFLAERIMKDFAIVLFDHHSDMQSSILSELLSCGNWLRIALEYLTHLKQVILVGTNEEALSSLLQKIFKGKQVMTFSENVVSGESDWFRELVGVIRYPVYLSVDKDVLSAEEAVTDWDQGSMKLQQLSDAFNEISNKHRIIGMDVCGEFSPVLGEPFMFQDANRKNNKSNGELLALWKKANG